jgi:eukaryotic-like serine/threonine-protein kinase
MDKARWQRVQLLFHGAAECPESERLSFLENAAGADRQLVADVLAMLEEDRRGSLLDDDVAQVAARLLDESGAGKLRDQEFGPYRIRGLLGEGGMGIVYLAAREDLESVAAIKVLRDAWMSPARRERFISEQRLLAQLTHPSIARLYDADTLADGTPWFAMEYVHGVALTEYCDRRGSGIEEKLKLLRAVCEAVRCAHSHAVIHRDLKPSNILVAEDGAVKLLDFGIAKQLDHREQTADQTRTALRLMTPAYAAPEQIRGEPVGIYTDVYALGVILYELLTGQPPFDLSKCTPVEAEMVLVNQEAERPSMRARRAGSAAPAGRAGWADLDVLCLTAMHKDPARRYASAEALIRDIDHYLAGEPLDARPDSLGYRAGKFLRRNRRSVAIATAAIALLAGLVLFYTLRLASARNAALAEAARTERVLRFTLNLFDGGDKEAGPARDLRVTTLLDRGVAEARSLDQYPAVQAELFETLGEVYQKLGDLDRANSLLQSALDRRRASFGPNNAEVAESEVQLGLLRSDQAKFADAERLVREGLAISERTLPPGHPQIAAATNALGKVLEDRGSYNRAIRVLNEAVRLRSGPGADPFDLADSLLELSNAEFYAGDYTKSKALNERLLVMHRQLYGPRHPLIAEDLTNLGAIAQMLGHYSEAEQYRRQALAITEAFYGPDHYKTATALTLLARALEFEKRYDEAKALLDRALAIQEKVFGKVHPRVASALNDLGTVALMRGRYADAAADFSRMVGIYRQVYGGKHYLIGVALANLGSVYLAQKENARAEALFRQALAMYARTLPPNHLNVAIARIKLGRALLREKRFKDAEPQSLTGYRILSKQASPSVSWLREARKDLSAIYTALDEPDKAKRFERPAA